MSSPPLWHSIPGRLQSVSVADRSNIWGVTLDLQLCRFDSSAQQWQLVSVTSESVNRSRFSASSTQSARSALTNGSLASVSSSSLSSNAAAKKISSLLLPAALSLGLSSPSAYSSNTQQQPQQGGLSTFSRPLHQPKENDSITLSDADSESDTTIQVSTAFDGTVVRLDKTQRTWYLIAPHTQCDFEKDVIWIDLGHLWKCVSVASVSQIWGLSDCGDIYYGTSDQFVQLEYSITSGAGYSKPNFTYISVGHDNLVLATDAHTGTVFRLKMHPTGSHPPVWTALPGTGSIVASGSTAGTTLHMINCTLSTADYIVGVTMDGHVYRFCNNNWISLGGGAKLDSVGVGADGYVMGVDRDGDLFGCQLQSTLRIPRRVSSRGASLSRYNSANSTKKEEIGSPSSPQAPNLPNGPTTPRLQGVSKRPLASPRELFEMAGATGAVSLALASSRSHNRSASRPDTAELSDAALATSPLNSRSNSYSSRYKLERSESQLSKKSSYASDIVSPSTSTSTSGGPLRGLNITESTSLQDDPNHKTSNARSNSPRPSEIARSSSSKSVPLRIQTGRIAARGAFADQGYFADRDRHNESSYSSKPLTTIGFINDASPPTSVPFEGNPYSTESRASPQLASSSLWSERDHMPLSAKTSSSSASRSFRERLYDRQQSHNGINNDAPDGYPDGKQEADGLREGEEGHGLPGQGVSANTSIMASYVDSSARPWDAVRGSDRIEKTGQAEPEAIYDDFDAALPSSVGSESYIHNSIGGSDSTAAVATIITSASDNKSTSGSFPTSTPPFNHSFHGYGSGRGHGYDTPPPDKSEWIEEYGTYDHSPHVGVNMTQVPAHGEYASYETMNDEGAYLSRERGAEYTAVGQQGLDQDKRDWIHAHSNNGSSDNNRYDSNNDYRNDYRSVSPASPQDPRNAYSASRSFTDSALPSRHQQLFASEKEELDLHNRNPDRPSAASLSSHRPSDASELLMLQQQAELLRRTKLRSSLASMSFDNANNNTATMNRNSTMSGTSEHASTSNNNRHSSGSFNAFDLRNTDLLIDDSQGAVPFRTSPGYMASVSALNTPISGASTPANGGGNNGYNNTDIDMSAYPRRAIRLNSVDAMMPQHPLDDEAPGRPSYSSSHLQQYLDTTLATQTAMAATDSRRNLRRAGDEGGLATGVDSSGTFSSGLQRRSKPTSQGGIQGEDEQGRWIAGNDSDARVVYFDSEVRKSKCCLIL